MKSRFVMWCIAGSDSESATNLWLDVGSRYCEPLRHYHTLDHIAASLAHLDAVEVNAAVEGAIWFHDVIYDPARRDNEEQSAAFFLETTRPWIDPDLAERIQLLIMATDPRTERIEHPDHALITDIDLAILGAEAADYDAYAKAIRAEYGHVPDEEFRMARAAVMKRFLDAPIYRTPTFRHLEAQARRNIEEELAALAVGPGDVVA